MIQEKVTVAAIQMRNDPLNKEMNFLRAEQLIREAYQKGARIILLPELQPGGYLASEAVWPLAEGENGPTTTWQKTLAHELAITLGAGFPLWRGDDLLNVYQVCDSEGAISGRVEKRKTETDVFLPGKPGNLIATSAGSMGLGICADNHLLSFLKEMIKLSPDWMAMPHAWPVPVRTGGPVSPADIQKGVDDMKHFPLIYSQTLGIPVVFANATGPLLPMSGAIGKLMDPRYFALGGHSMILDHTGRCLAALEDEEGVIVAEIEPGRRGNSLVIPESYDGWLHKGNLIMRKILMPLGNFTSRRRYSRQRAARAEFAQRIHKLEGR